MRRVRECETTNDLSAFLTMEPNAIGAPIHAKAMPVIQPTQEEIDARMSARASTITGLTALLSAQGIARNDLIEG